MHKKYHCFRRVSFLFRQERYERSRPRGGAEKLLPQLQAPSPWHPSRTLFRKAQRMLRHERIKGASWEAPFSQLAAAAVVIAAAVIAAAVAAPHVTAAAVAEQENQNDDPADVTAAETVIVTHKYYLQEFLSGCLPLIPRYSGERIWCKKYRRGIPLRYGMYLDYPHRPSGYLPSAESARSAAMTVGLSAA